MPHVQERASHLSLYLGQHAIDAGWVARATSDPGGDKAPAISLPLDIVRVIGYIQPIG
jgi:hypothetical protein